MRNLDKPGRRVARSCNASGQDPDRGARGRSGNQTPANIGMDMGRAGINGACVEDLEHA